MLQAAEAARRKDARVIAFTGRAGSKLEAAADLCFCAEAALTARSQEIHQLAYHIICDLVERVLPRVSRTGRVLKRRMSNTAVFFDRDGTLIHDPGYLNHPDQVQVMDGVAEAVKEFQVLGYKTVVASNQSGVARGIVTRGDAGADSRPAARAAGRQRRHAGRDLLLPLSPRGHRAGVSPRTATGESPDPGMLLAAAQEMDIDLSRSWMIGDSDRDVEAGRSAGCKTILIGSTASESADPGEEQAGLCGREHERGGEYRQETPSHACR